MPFGWYTCEKNSGMEGHIASNGVIHQVAAPINNFALYRITSVLDNFVVRRWIFWKHANLLTAKTE